MRRVIFVNRFFFPDHSATSQILSDLAFHLADNGREVHVVTGTQIYDAPKARLPAYEIVNKVEVHRVPSARYGRGALLGRTIDYLTFYRSVWRCLMRITHPGDLLVAMTDPPLISLLMMVVAQRKGAALINWLQDLYPEVARALGISLIQGPVAGALGTLRNSSLRGAIANVTVGELMGQRLADLGIPSASVRLIPNWCDDDEVRPLMSEQNPLRQTWNLDGKFVLGYSGNLGRVHQFATVLAAAEILRDEPRFVFLVIGGGNLFDELQQAVKSHALSGSFRFLPYQERSFMAYSLGVCDLHWVSLNPALEGLVVPSKFYGIAAAGKPVIVIGARDGELARLAERYCCGLTVEPGDAAALVAALRRLSNAPEIVADMGRRARHMIEVHFSRRQALARWDELLEEIEENPTREPSVAAPESPLCP